MYKEKNQLRTMARKEEETEQWLLILICTHKQTFLSLSLFHVLHSHFIIRGYFNIVIQFWLISMSFNLCQSSSIFMSVLIPIHTHTYVIIIIDCWRCTACISLLPFKYHSQNQITCEYKCVYYLHLLLLSNCIKAKQNKCQKSRFGQFKFINKNQSCKFNILIFDFCSCFLQSSLLIFVHWLRSNKSMNRHHIEMVCILVLK